MNKITYISLLSLTMLGLSCNMHAWKMANKTPWEIGLNMKYSYYMQDTGNPDPNALKVVSYDNGWVTLAPAGQPNDTYSPPGWDSRTWITYIEANTNTRKDPKTGDLDKGKIKVKAYNERHNETTIEVVTNKDQTVLLIRDLSKPNDFSNQWDKDDKEIKNQKPADSK